MHGLGDLIMVARVRETRARQDLRGPRVARREHTARLVNGFRLDT